MKKKPTRIAADYIDEKVGLDWANKYNQKSCSDSVTPKLPCSLLKSCVFSNSPRILVGARRSPHALRSDDATSSSLPPSSSGHNGSMMNRGLVIHRVVKEVRGLAKYHWSQRKTEMSGPF